MKTTSRASAPPRRVLLILLDGADRDLILEWCGAGLLPWMSGLLERGAWGTTLGPLGLHSGATWHSLVTGVNPARHGRYGGDRQIRSGTYRLDRFHPGDVKAEPFWGWIGRAGRRVAVVDVPYLPPDPGINGIHVVDWCSHASDSGFCTSPPELARDVVARFGNDPIGLCDDLRLRDTADLRRFRDDLVARVGLKRDLSRHYLERGDWDLFVTAFGESHCVGHQCWHLHDPAHPRHDARAARALGDPVRDVYRALDAAAADLAAAAGSDTTLCLVATHGMGPFYNGAHLLEDVLHRLGHGPAPGEATAAWRLARRAWRLLPHRLRSRLAPLQKGIVDQVQRPLDPEAACYSLPNGEVCGAIRVNLVGREPLGRIRPGAEYDAFCRDLERELGALVNVGSGRPAVRSILRTAALYRGPHLDDLPDLLVEWNTDAPLDAVQSERVGTIRRVRAGPRSGHHRRAGLFAAVGPGIRQGPLGSFDVTDLAPTLGALLDVPPPELDGRPLPCVGVPELALPQLHAPQ